MAIDPVCGMTVDANLQGDLINTRGRVPLLQRRLPG